jgi:hypothetical protein
LELVDPREAVKAGSVWLRGLPGFFLDGLVARYTVYRGGRDAKRRLPVTGEELLAAELAARSAFTLSAFAASPQYFYTLLHALGCRKLALFPFGMKPLDEEGALRDVAVMDVPLLHREYRPWVRHRSVRVVLLEAVPGPEPLGRFDRGGEAEGPAARGARLTEEKRAGLSDAIARWLRSAGV